MLEWLVNWAVVVVGPSLISALSVPGAGTAEQPGPGVKAGVTTGIGVAQPGVSVVSGGGVVLSAGSGSGAFLLGGSGLGVGPLREKGESPHQQGQQP